MAGSESGVAGHAMATLRGAAPAMTQQALAASTSSCPPGSKIRNAHLMWMDEVKMKLRRRARFRWEKSPKTVLFVKKVGDREVSARSREMAEWLLRRGLQVYVEPEAKATGDFPGDCEPWNPQDDTVSLVERRARRDHRTDSNRTPLSLSVSQSIYPCVLLSLAGRHRLRGGRRRGRHPAAFCKPPGRERVLQVRQERRQASTPLRVLRVSSFPLSYPTKKANKG